MKKNIRSLFGHELVRGSILVFAGNILANFLNYLFHVITGRLLGPEQYAVIASLLSLVYVFGFPSTIVNILMTRKIAALSAKNDLPAIKGMLLFMMRKTIYFSIAVICFFYFFRQYIASFLNLDQPTLIVLLGISFALGFLLTVSLAVFQGLLRFVELSILNTLSSFLRDVLALLAIVMGFGVMGIMWGSIITGIISMILSFYFLRFLLRIQEKKRHYHIKSYISAVWVFFGLFGITLMLNIDVMLVKHFFSSYDAGLYAALTTMGKIVFFISSSIAFVLLPIAARKKETGIKSSNDLTVSLMMVSLVSGGVLVLYLFVPKLVITLLYGMTYVQIYPYLWLTGLYFLCYNLSYILINYYISLHKKKILLAPMVAAAAQVTLIYLFHRSFYQVLTVMTSTAALLLLTLWVYYRRNEKYA